MSRYFYLIPLILCYCASAQNALSYSGARGWGMGNATVALSQPQSFFDNPAGIAFYRGISASTSYDSRFGIAGLNTVSAMFLRASDKWAFAAGGERFGDRLYSESKFGLALAKATERVALGLKASYLAATVENSAAGLVYTEFGVMARPASSVTLGMLARNLTGARWYGQDPLPFTLNLGGAFSPIPQLTCTAEADYWLHERVSFRSGLEYVIREPLSIRAGINTRQKSNHFGLGFIRKPWQMDYAVHTHPTLGLSHHLSLNLQIKPGS